MGHSAVSSLPAHKIRRCIEALDDAPVLSEPELRLIRFTSDYYHHPVGEVVAAAMPALLRQGKTLYPSVETIAVTDSGERENVEALQKRAPRQAELLTHLMDAGGTGIEADRLNEELPNWRRAAASLLKKGHITRFEARSEDFDERLVAPPSDSLILNEDQQRALESLRRSDDFGVFLIDGVTGSGKTEVYLQRMKDVIDLGKQVLVLALRDTDAAGAAAAFEQAVLPEWFDELAAVRDGGFFAVDGHGLFSRPGPRVFEGIAVLAELFEPEIFAGMGPVESWLPLAPIGIAGKYRSAEPGDRPGDG